MLESAPRRSATVWGDEHDAVDAALRWAIHRVVRPSNPKTTARPAAELAAAAGDTITPQGIGAEGALRVFTEILEPATRAQDDPMNLAYIPAAPTRAAIAFDLVTSSANIFGGLWEAGAGAIWAENQALRWIADLLGWGPEAMGCFVSGGTTGNLSALAAARHRALTARGSRPAEGWQVACSAGAHSSIAAAARILDVEVIDVLHNFRPDQDLILIRTPHPILDRAHIVAGMSGSPVYLDGRLAGPPDRSTTVPPAAASGG